VQLQLANRAKEAKDHPSQAHDKKGADAAAQDSQTATSRHYVYIARPLIVTTDLGAVHAAGPHLFTRRSVRTWRAARTSTTVWRLASARILACRRVATVCNTVEVRHLRGRHKAESCRVRAACCRAGNAHSLQRRTYREQWHCCGWLLAARRCKRRCFSADLHCQACRAQVITLPGSTSRVMQQSQSAAGQRAAFAVQGRDSAREANGV
jgi:hypothetical protein